MATISSLGVGSGSDASSIITQLMAIEKQPLTNLQSADPRSRPVISGGKIKTVSTLNDTAGQARLERLLAHHRHGSSSNGGEHHHITAARASAQHSIAGDGTARRRPSPPAWPPAPPFSGHRADHSAPAAAIRWRSRSTAPTRWRRSATRSTRPGARRHRVHPERQQQRRLMMCSNARGWPTRSTTWSRAHGMDGLAFNAAT